MYLCETCEKIPIIFEVNGDSRCPIHGLSSFHIESLVEYCSECAEKAQRCQVCGGYVNAREYNERHGHPIPAWTKPKKRKA